VDEANAAIGVLRLHARGTRDIDAMLARVQNDLFDLGADLSVPGEAGDRLRMTDGPVARLESDPRIARAILKLAEDPAFDDRPEEIRTACYHALAEAGGDSVVPALEEQVTQGNWFARPSWRRSAAAYALARIGTEAARAALDRGLKHASETVRASCRDALERRAA